MRCDSKGFLRDLAFEHLVAEAESRTFEGWDFAYLRGRLVETSTPWDYQRIVAGLIPAAASMVDIGTGGGELLASLRPLPLLTLATEGYHPNVSVAKRRLQPLGVEVVEVLCDDNKAIPQRGALPFRDSSVDLVIDRHESFIASEVFRILRPLGLFVTQQVGESNYPELNIALGVRAQPASESWNLREAVRQIESAGLMVIDSREAKLEASFSDVGAVVNYLKAIPWQVPGFTTETYRERLKELDKKIRKNGPFKVTSRRFLVQAQKPSIRPEGPHR